MFRFDVGIKKRIRDQDDKFPYRHIKYDGCQNSGLHC